jgi:hypothetical protein
MSQSPKVFIVIINWNQHEDAIECVESVKGLDYDNFEIVVVDNASRESSVKMIRGRFPDLRIIENSENLGYAGGNNIGIRYALDKSADYVLILNSDIVLDRYALKNLISVAQQDKDAGIFAPKVYYYDRRSIINSLGTSINWFRLRPNLGECGQEDYGQFNKAEQKDVLVGCALLIKKTTFEKIGFFNENYFAFHEDADLCLRNIKCGGKNLTVPGAVAYHKVAGSVKEHRPLVNYYTIRNFLYLARDNASSLNRTRVYIGLGFLILKNAFNLLSGDSGKRELSSAFFHGVGDYFAGKTGKTQRAF